MKKNMVKIKNLFVVVLVLLLSGCGPSIKLVNSWHDNENSSQKYEKIGVAVLFPNNSNRYVTERAIVEQLKSNGLNAFATYDVFPFAAKAKEITGDDEKNKEELTKMVKEKIKEQNYDGFIIVSAYDKIMEKRWENDRSLMAGGTAYYGTYYGIPRLYDDFYYYSMGTIYNDGHYVDETTYFLQCNLYDVESRKPVWKAETKAVNVKFVEEEATKLAEIIATELNK